VTEYAAYRGIEALRDARRIAAALDREAERLAGKRAVSQLGGQRGLHRVQHADHRNAHRCAQHDRARGRARADVDGHVLMTHPRGNAELRSDELAFRHVLVLGNATVGAEHLAYATYIYVCMTSYLHRYSVAEHLLGYMHMLLVESSYEEAERRWWGGDWGGGAWCGGAEHHRDRAAAAVGGCDGAPASGVAAAQLRRVARARAAARRGCHRGCGGEACETVALGGVVTARAQCDGLDGAARLRAALERHHSPRCRVPAVSGCAEERGGRGAGGAWLGLGLRLVY
jgi:hypothetical protein